MRCPACAHDNSDADRFCVACGARLEPRCPTCGAPAQPAARFCGSCGAALNHEASGAASTPAAPVSAAQAAEGERRQLTVLFCDLVNSTGLSVRLDPEELRDLVRAYQEDCAEIVARFGGHIAQYLGDGILVYFGYPRAHEDDAVRAVQAGLAITASARSHRDASPPVTELGVRVGIHTGLVVVGEIGGGERHEHLALGETPNLAARLQALAATNEVVISAATQRLTQGFFNVESLGLPALRGFNQPMAVFCVLGETGVSHRLDMAAPSGLSPLVGREEEVGLLLERWKQASADGLEVVIVAGEPGIGKSRLVRVLRERLREAGESFAWVELRCSQLHQQSALYPLIDHYRRLLQFTPDDAPETRMEKLESTLAAYDIPLPEAVPLFAPLLSLPLPDRYQPPALSAERQKQRTLEVSLTWLRKEALRQPLLFVVEDLQWIDPSTLEFLSLLIEAQPELPILAILTARQEFVPPWSFSDRLHLLTLGRLGRTHAVAVARGVAGGKELPPELEAQIVARTDGVPLFVEELARTVLESGLMQEQGACYVLTAPLPALAIPETLQDSLMARLDYLSAVPSVKEVAQIGAVIGRDFEHELLQAVAGIDDLSLRQAVSRLVEAGVVIQRGLPPSAHYRFRHSLIQEAAYESLLRSRRQQLHRQVARALEEGFAEVAEMQPELLAHHFAAGGERGPAVGYFALAGQRAARRYAIQEALSFYQRALELTPMGTEQDELLAERAKLLLGQFRGREAVQDFERLATNARQSGDRRRELESLLGLASAQQIIALDDPEGVAKSRELYEQAYALARAIGDKAGMARALIPTRNLNSFWPDYRQRAKANIEEAVALSRELADEELIIASTLAQHGFLGLDESEQSGEELRALLESRHDLVRLNEQLFRLMWIHLGRGNYERCVECCDEGIRVAMEIGAYPVQYPTIKALALLGLGRYGEAWAALQQEVADEAHPFGQAHKALGVGVYLVELMAYEEAIGTLKRVVEQARQLSRVWMRRWASLLLAFSLGRLGQLDEMVLARDWRDLPPGGPRAPYLRRRLSSYSIRGGSPRRWPASRIRLVAWLRRAGDRIGSPRSN